MATATEIEIEIETETWQPFDVSLRPEHLEHGVPRSCKWCAVALAVIEAVGAWRFVDVAADGRIIVRGGAGRHVEARVEDPELVAAIVRAVDAGRADAVTPGVFRIWCPFPPLEELTP